MSAHSSSKNKWIEGNVHWYDDQSGEGMIRSDEGDLFYVHSSAIDAFAKAKLGKEAALKDNQKVKFQLFGDFDLKQVSKVKEV
jgi:cold shock CspA family protein